MFKIDDLKTKQIQKWLVFFAFFIFVLFNLILTITHESFRDEAQAWLIAKNSSILGIIKFSWQEGHPWLWHLILYPFAKFGFTYQIIKFISFAIITFTAWLIIKFAPFNKIISVFLIFGVPFVYYYSAIARNYCLIALGTILIACSWKYRAKRPILLFVSIAILASSHAIVWAPALIIFIGYIFSELFIFDNFGNKHFKINFLISLSICIILILLFNLPLISQVVYYLNKDLLLIILSVALLIIAFCVFGYITKTYKKINLYLKENFTTYFFTLGTVFSVLSIFIFIINIVMDLHNQAAFTTTKLFAIIPVLIMFAWIYSECKQSKFKILKSLNINSFAVICIILIFLFNISYCRYDFILKDINLNYTEAKITAEYIDKNLNNNELIVCTQKPTATAIQAYLKKNTIIDINTDKPLSYVNWYTDKHYSSIPDNFFSKIKSYNRIVYIIQTLSPWKGYKEFNKTINELINSNDAEIIFKANKAYYDINEEYQIVKINNIS